MLATTEPYNTRNAFVSPQKKPIAGALIKTFTATSNSRPSSAIKNKFDSDPNVNSPHRTDSKTPKKLSITRYPSNSNSNRNNDPRTGPYRRRNDEPATSTHLSRSNSKWEKQLSIETSTIPNNYSSLNLKGFSVNQSSSHLPQRPSLSLNSPLSTKFSVYTTNAPLTMPYTYQNRNGPPSQQGIKPSPAKKFSSDKFNSSVNTSGASTSTNERSLSIDRTLYGSLYPSPKKQLHLEEEFAYLPPFEPTKCSVKQNGVIKAYAVNTHQGIVRNYNEDRVAIILNIMRPPHLAPTDEWPLCSFFGVYDGHGGTACADFLRDNLHQYVVQDKNFPKNPVEALKKGFEEAERVFKEIAQQNPKGDIERSGSCATVALIVEDMCYIANVGDSRIVASFEQGRKILPLSRDHKPNDKDEQKRIINFGGKIYQSQLTQPPGFPGPKVILGPHRVFPGRLSVSRTFGDIEAKLPRYGGNPYVVIAEPEIKTFKITKDWDYIILASDGIFDKMENNDVANSIWSSLSSKENDVHKQSAVGVERLMKESLVKKTLDNITVVMVSFSGFERAVTGEPADSKAYESAPLKSTGANSLGNSEHQPLYTATPMMKTYLGGGGGIHDRSTMSGAGRRFDTSSASLDYGKNTSMDRSNNSFWKSVN